MSGSQTFDEFRGLLERSGLLSANLFEPIFAAAVSQASDGNPREAVSERLLQEHLLTPYQFKLLSSGRLDEFFLNAKYKVLDFIGEGGMGKVFLCEHLILQRLVAVKILQIFGSAGDPVDPSVVERFYREARAIAALDHPNIVRVFDVDRLGASPFMVMEYLDGANLHQIVSQFGPLSLERAVSCIKQAAAGLEHAHRAGLIHRDIKPSNLLLERQGAVKLLDLGLARFARDPSRNQAITARYDNDVVMGTVDYMAPEQAVDTSTVDIRGDIYSLGCSAYFMLTGRPPFPTGTVPQKMYAHQTQAPEPISMLCPKLPEAFAAVIGRMMEKNPSERFQSPGEIVEALACFANVSGFADELVPPPEREMPTIPASSFRLGLSQMAASDTPTPVNVSATLVLPGIKPRNLSGSVTPVVGPKAEPSSNDISFVLQVPPRLKRRRRVAAYAGLAFLLAAATGGLFWWQLGPRTTNSSNTVDQTGKADPAANPLEAQKTDPSSGRPAPFRGAILSGGGSTLVDRMMHLWARAYEEQFRVRINYQSVGSGKGCQGMIDRVYTFGCSDAPMTDEQLANAAKNGGKVLHIPLVMGAVVPCYNLPDVNQRLNFSGPILADIYLGKIKRWNDQAVKISNPGVHLPDMPIKVVHRADKSGTTFIWTDFLSETSGDWKTRFGSGRTSLPWPVGIEGTGSDGVASLVSQNIGAIGYVELSWALENNLRFGQVKNRMSIFIEPKLESVTAAAAASLRNIPPDLRYSLTNAPGEESYPIAGTTWAIIYADQTSNIRARELVEFLRWLTHEGQAYVNELKFAPLPPDLVKLIDDKLTAVQLPPK